MNRKSYYSSFHQLAIIFIHGSPLLLMNSTVAHHVGSFSSIYCSTLYPNFEIRNSKIDLHCTVVLHNLFASFHNNDPNE